MWNGRRPRHLLEGCALSGLHSQPLMNAAVGTEDKLDPFFARS
jgi:hypothetical protein